MGRETCMVTTHTHTDDTRHLSSYWAWAVSSFCWASNVQAVLNVKLTRCPRDACTASLAPLLHTHTQTLSASVPTVSLHTHIPYVLLTPNGEHNRISVYCVAYVDNIYIHANQHWIWKKHALARRLERRRQLDKKKKKKKNESQTSLYSDSDKTCELYSYTKVCGSPIPDSYQCIYRTHTEEEKKLYKHMNEIYEYIQ